ncbi:MAG: hypothetical protein SVK08_01715 [Halobacteriota archaeon]|nr:hypothetical protein [Halobacteriota archaeon]
MNLEEKKELTKHFRTVTNTIKDLPEEFQILSALIRSADGPKGAPFAKEYLPMCDYDGKSALILAEIVWEFRTQDFFIKQKGIHGCRTPYLSTRAIKVDSEDWAEFFNVTPKCVNEKLKLLEQKEFITFFWKKDKKAGKNVRWAKVNAKKIEESFYESKLELASSPAKTRKFSPEKTERFSSYNKHTRSRIILNSSENTSYFPQNYNNKNSSNSVKPRLKLRSKVLAKKKNQNFVDKAKPAKNKKLRLRSNAKKLKDAALHSEPADLRSEKRKNKPIKRVPAKVQECIDHWNNSGLREHRVDFNNPTKTLQQSIRLLKQLLSGKAFGNGHMVEDIDPKFKTKIFTVDEWKKSVDNFAKVVLDPTYQNVCKHYGKKVSIPDFIYKHDWPSESRPKSHFCYNLKYDPKVVKPKYRMPELTSAPKQLYDAFLKLLSDEYSMPTNLLTDEEKVYLAIFIRDFHLNILNLYNQNKLEKTFAYLWSNGAFGPDGLAEKVMELLQSEWPGPPMQIPFNFIVNKRRIDRLHGSLKRMGWMN